jgi:hypothetical protein
LQQAFHRYAFLDVLNVFNPVGEYDPEIHHGAPSGPAPSRCTSHTSFTPLFPTLNATASVYGTIPVLGSSPVRNPQSPGPSPQAPAILVSSPQAYSCIPQLDYLLSQLPDMPMEHRPAPIYIPLPLPHANIEIEQVFSSYQGPPPSVISISSSCSTADLAEFAPEEAGSEEWLSWFPDITSSGADNKVSVLKTSSPAGRAAESSDFGWVSG